MYFTYHHCPEFVPDGSRLLRATYRARVVSRSSPSSMAYQPNSKLGETCDSTISPTRTKTPPAATAERQKNQGQNYQAEVELPQQLDVLHAIKSTW